MTEGPGEAIQTSTRLLKCTLEIAHCRAYWAQMGRGRERPGGAAVPGRFGGTSSASPRRMGGDARGPGRAQEAFEQFWFGTRSLERVQMLLANMRVRFNAFPSALEVLGQWLHMSADTRRAICHWHLQLADPLYRRFTGVHLVERRQEGRDGVTRDTVVAWLGSEGPAQWTMSTRIQYASKLLSAAYAAGLVASNRDRRPLSLPRVPSEALAYLMYLLRETRFQGSLLDNPYLGSVGLSGSLLDERLRELPGLRFRRQGSLIEFGWSHPDLRAWAADRVLSREPAVTEGVR